MVDVVFMVVKVQDQKIGKNTLRPQGNKNALVTGEYKTISFDTLLAEEKILYEKIPEEINSQVKGRYKTLEI